MIRVLRRLLHPLLLAAAIVLVLSVSTSRAQTSAPRLASEQTDTPPAENNTAPENTSKLSFLHLLTQGGWAMIPLGVCSLVGLALIIERGMALRRSQILPPTFFPGLDKVFHGANADIEPALAYCRRNPSAVSRITSSAIRKLPDSMAAAEQAAADQGATEVARLRRNLRLMHGISAITPTLGLLGTVWGMIRAFEAASRVGLGHSEALTTGIYEALVATMTGLLIAVPVLFFYYIYLSLIDRSVLELNDSVQAFLERHSTSADLSTPVPAA
ncbi:MAG: MotA/TolQ/ExbB proton channel family protein [Phycisphaerae bacterium]